MTLQDVEKVELIADEIEHLSHRSINGEKDSEILGTEKNRNQANHLRQVCKELRERADY